MKKIGILLKKEMTEILRDKKTLIIMLVLPLLLYPSILIGMSLGISMIMQSEEEKEHTVGYLLEDEEYIEPLISLYEQEKEELGARLSFRGASREEEAVIKEETDAWLYFSKEEQSIQIQLDYTSTSQKSDYTESIMKELVDKYRNALLTKNLEKEGLTEDFLHPVTYEAVDSATLSESMGMNMGGSIGMIIIIMILMGAFYPAVDVTAGEKERGTLETLLTLPVTNFQMIMSKFISVSIISCITAVISLLALGGSILFIMLALPGDELVQIPVGAFVNCIPVMLLVMVTTALLLTALSMCFCVFAKSTKEANNYMTPVMLVVMLATMIGMFPTVELDYKTALIPIVNVSLLIKQVLAQAMDLSLALITILVNCAYSVLIIWILARMYDSEDIMFSDGFRSFRLFQKREDIKRGTIPATGDVLISLIVLLLAIIYLGGMISMRNQFIGTAIIQLMIVAVPLALTWYMKSDVKILFSLQKPEKKTIVGSILLYIGTYLVMFMLSIVLSKLLPSHLEGLEMAFEEMMKQPFVLLVLVIAVMPAIGEELLFRGLVFGSMRQKYKVAWAIFLSALFFGAYHTNLVKLIPTGLLGACFAYIVYKSGSIFISMFLHFTNNFLSVIAMKYPETMEKVLPFMVKEELSTIELMIMLVLGIVFVAAGLFLINRKKEDK
ncbi:MAG: ABC transporter permease subunit [Lachnospiraceae bacterium]|nr:ABC transporter permease subunit [Lachnospiraceae bacterium]